MIEPGLHDDAPVTTRRTLRQFAGLCLAASAAILGWPLVTGGDRGTVASVMAALAAALGMLGLAAPERIRLVYSALLAMTKPIGWVVSMGVLALLFYAVFTPVAFLFRMVGRDVLDRRRPERMSHWVEKPMSADPRSYLRQ